MGAICAALLFFVLVGLISYEYNIKKDAICDVMYRDFEQLTRESQIRVIWECGVRE